MLTRWFENWPYKLMALVCAIALHTYVSGQNPSKSRTISVPLSVRNLPPGLLMGDQSSLRVTLSLEGPPEEIDRLTETNLIASVDLGHVQAGKNAGLRIDVSPPVSARGLVSVTDTQPGTATVFLEARASRRLPVTATPPGTPPAGFTFRAPEVAPRQAVVSGAASAVRSVAELQVRTDGTHPVGSLDDDLPLVALASDGSVVEDVQIVPPVAHVQFEMAKAPAMKSVLISPTIIGAPPFPYKVSDVLVKPNAVTLAGRPETLARTGTVGTLPIDVSGATADVVREVQVAPLPGLSVTGLQTITVTVHIVTQQPVVAPAPAP